MKPEQLHETRPQTVVPLIVEHWTMSRDGLDQKMTDLEKQQSCPPSLAERLRQEVRKWVNGSIAANRRHYETQALDAEYEQKNSTKRAEAARVELAAAKEAHITIPVPQRLRTLLYIIGCGIAIASDFAFTWSVLPAILQIPRNSVIGVLLGLTPLVAGILLEYLFETVLAGIHADHLFKAPVVKAAILGVVLLSSITLVFAMNYYLAESRSLAEKILLAVTSGRFTDPSKPILTASDQTFLDWSVMVMSMAVVFATGVLFMNTFADLRNSKLYRLVRKRLKKAQIEAEKEGASAAAADKKAAYWKMMLNKHDEYLKPVMESYGAEYETRISRLCPPQDQDQPKSLARSMRARILEAGAPSASVVSVPAEFVN